jgi:hypothetical protein
MRAPKWKRNDFIHESNALILCGQSYNHMSPVLGTGISFLQHIQALDTIAKSYTKYICTNKRHQKRELNNASVSDNP